jgi:uncharacterized protein (TIGR02996 family)
MDAMRILVVEGLLAIHKNDLMLRPEAALDGDAYQRLTVELRRPDGSVALVAAQAEVASCGAERHTVFVRGLTEDDVPIGTEVWLVSSETPASDEYDDDRVTDARWLTATPYQPTDAAEAGFIESLRTNPLDQDVRAVYADWLEERSQFLRAKLLRAKPVANVDHLAQAGDHAWRAITARAPIEHCSLAWIDDLQLDGDGSIDLQCPNDWSALTTTEHDRVRDCRRCKQPVYYCASAEEAGNRGRGRLCIVIDAGVSRDKALAAYSPTDDASDTE